MQFLSIDDFDFEGKTVLIRVDLNSPIDLNGRIMDTTRISRHARTIRELSERGAKVIVLAHQGRPGRKDFLSLHAHSQLLTESIGKPVNFVCDLFGPFAQERINKMTDGDITLLENVRFYAEDALVDGQQNTNMVKNLSGLADYFVNDAFGAAHRSQTSIVGFSGVMPNIAGRVMEKEVNVLSDVQIDPGRPFTLVLGGVKTDDAMNVMENMLRRGKIDCVLTGGLVALLLMRARGHKLGRPSDEVLTKTKCIEDLPKAKELLEKYGKKIQTPVDVAIEVSGKRVDVSSTDLPMDFRILDIGKETIAMYKEKIKNSRNVLANGPMGMFEQNGFEIGTQEVLKAMANRGVLAIVGGGHTTAVTKEIGIDDKIYHISTGGGAFMLFVSGEDLPAIKVLKNSAEVYKKIS